MNNGLLSIAEIKIGPYQRALKPQQVAAIRDSMEAHGYNPAYPVIVDSDGVLVDGGHRIAAARALGIDAVPYMVKPDGISAIRFSLQCNIDQTLGAAPDVFDIAELAYELSKSGWDGQTIADELALGSTGRVSQHIAIKARLHPAAWGLARYGFTSTPIRADGESDDMVNQEFTTVNWSERLLRSLIQPLSWDGDRSVMRAQMRTLRAVYAWADNKDKRFGAADKPITAKRVGDLAEREAWYAQLGRHMRDGLVQRVPLRDRVNLLKSVYAGVYGDKAEEANLAKFDNAVKRLNEHVLGVTLYCDDAFQRIPLLEDGSIALVVTDPPYNVTEHEWDKIGTDDEFIEFTCKWLDAIRPKLAQDFQLFVFCDPDYAARIETEVLRPGDWPLQSRIVWSNRSLPSGRQVSTRFARTWQMLFHIGNHDLNWPKEWNDARFDVQVYAAPNNSHADGGYHPTPKPQALIKYLVELGSKPTDIVLDPFAGGGTTGAACAEVKQRQCILIEREDEFCKNIERRLQIERMRE